MRTLALATLSVFAAFLLAGCGSTTLDEEALQKEIEAIHSTAAEGALLAHDAAEERTTKAFTEVHSKALGEQVDEAQVNLRGGVPGELRFERATATVLAVHVSSDLSRLHRAAGNPVLAREIADSLDRWAQQAEELAQ